MLGLGQRDNHANVSCDVDMLVDLYSISELTGVDATM